ncbi:hypothetical protein WJX73_001594 [Symbiochloris irregularis]|uniref:Fe2OG dioxygenase domain-containing protein n=1 Tax=Symbiochloris irregularis TaxID=706552 RepID=A0AAW1PBQ9_9CHLO
MSVPTALINDHLDAHFLATDQRPSHKRQKRELALDQLTPCELIRDFLPEDLAARLLQQLLKDSESWTQGTWWIAGKEHTAPRSSSYYSVGDREALERHKDSGNALDVSSRVAMAAGPASLQTAAQLCTYALANLYKDGQQGVGAHSDKLTQLGPRPTIASLSLGASRLFRVRRAGTVDAAAEGREPAVELADLMLPHNTLVIMFPPTQEEWRHEVPKTKSQCKPHPASGTARLNLTFRSLKPEWQRIGRVNES